MKTFTVTSDNNTKTTVQANSKEDAKQIVMKRLSKHWSQILFITQDKVGRPKQNNVQYKRNIKPEYVEKMDLYLNQLKNEYLYIS